jgi:hypothetical protein
MRASYRRRTVWTKVHALRWEYRPGYAVCHCGHPTALWPYHGVTPRTSLLLAPNGQGFAHLNAAQLAVEADYLAHLTG